MRHSFLLSSLPLLFFCTTLLLLQRTKGEEQRAVTPPRGWNSYDSFSWIISEEEFLQNAEILSQKLKAYGYQYVVVDYLWYRRKVEGASQYSLGLDEVDEWGRVIPDPDRWPSSKGGKGFTEVANKVHAMGLKFGIHVMRGISAQAVKQNTRILDTSKGGPYEEAGRQWVASDIGVADKACSWLPGFMSVNTNLGAGRAYMRSLYQQYADWGVDFVKNDCVFGDNFDLDQIQSVSQVLNELNQPILYSLSPGTRATPAMAAKVSSLTNMYRVTGDDWDTWNDVAPHFDVARDFVAANMTGANGLKGLSWPDLDMLPLGWLTDPAANEGPHRKTNLTPEEQRTQVTLWAIAKSPLMFGGDLRNIDAATFDIITNPFVLEVNSFSYRNTEFPHITGTPAVLTDGNSNSKRILPRKSSSMSNARKLSTHALSLTSCKNHEAKGWVSVDHDKELGRVCWKYPLGSRYKPQFCMNKKKPVLTANEETVYEGKRHLLATDNEDLCLDASPSRKVIRNEIQSRSFSPCRSHPSQMWDLQHNGTLMSSYSGLCATVKAVKANTDGGIRAWAAIGRHAESYVAFFNLSPDRMVISAKLSDLSSAVPLGPSCTYREVWTQPSIKEVTDTLSFTVESHGCALFVLVC